MKFSFQKFSIILVLLLVISVGFNIAAALTDGAEPGSEQDPLISKSYVDDIMAKNSAEVAALKQQLEEFKLKSEESKKQYDELKLQSEDYLKQLGELKTQIQSGGSEGFIVLTLETGQTLLPGGGTELILRSGTAVGVAGQNGDTLADVTSAKDLVKGAAVVKNHLLISSRDDGRGIKAANKCYLLVRGAHKIKEPAQNESSIEEPAQGNDGGQGGTGSTPVVTEQKGKVTASALNVRAEPNTTAAILGKVVKGDIVTILSTQGEWINIKTAAGVKGWVMKQYVTLQ